MAVEAALRHGLQDPCPSQDRLLLVACQQDDSGAFACLRCHVSHPLEQKLLGIHRQYGSHYGLDLLALASYALDDAGQQLSYLQLRSLPTASIAPFTAQVVCSYELGHGAGLPHWARLKLQSHNGLKAHLRDHGLLLISEWALLADSSARRIRESLEVFGAGSLTVDRAVELHAAYRNHYPQAKAEHLQQTRRASGWVPSDAFLSLIAPDQAPNTTRDQLLAMDRAVRLVLSNQWQRARQQQDDGEAAYEVADPNTLAEVIEVDSASPAEQLALIEAALQRALAAVMPAVLAPAASDPQLHCLWQGYGEGLTNTPLAQHCGCARGTVSKKLRPEQHASSVARHAAAELSRQPLFCEVARSPEGAERMVEALRNHLLSPEREGDAPPLRRWVNQHLPPP
ncbi:hypothetical protein CyaNS01_02903 [Cyanobium sp. NS01]|nr:hypothetical protein CyaNS01_02903 [Cyanobium sp. NS01]